MTAFFHRLSPESRQHRFFSFAEPSVEFVQSLCDSSNPRQKLTMVVTRATTGEETIVAAGSYFARDEKSAEVAMAVEDQLQGRGIGAHLLERLALLAARAGLTRFWAITHYDNRPMIEVFRHSGFPVAEKVESGNLELDFSVIPTESSVEISEMRDRVVTAASLRAFFKPASVAVVGASRDESSIGYRILEALVMNRFQGPVYPVNPKATVVGSIRAHRSVTELPEPVDLAVIAVPRDAMLGVIDECAKRGVKAIIVITAGFAEAGTGGPGAAKKIGGKGARLRHADGRPKLHGSIEYGAWPFD